MTTRAARKGDELTVEFTVLGIPCLGLNGGTEFKHSEAFSFSIVTVNQAETDRYWNAIVGNGGKESQCGWCKDRWGLSWQITPSVLTEALAAGGGERKACLRGDDADEENRHRHHRGSAAGLTRGGKDQVGDWAFGDEPVVIHNGRRLAGSTRTRSRADRPSGTTRGGALTPQPRTCREQLERRSLGGIPWPLRRRRHNFPPHPVIVGLLARHGAEAAGRSPSG